MIKAEIVQKALGKTFADKLDEIAFEFGRFSFTRRQMIEDIDCANFNAASRLEKALKKLDVNTPLQLFKLDPYSLKRIKGVGDATIYVAMCILDYCEFNIEEWWGWTEESAFKRAGKRKHEL